MLPKFISIFFALILCLFSHTLSYAQFTILDKDTETQMPHMVSFHTALKVPLSSFSMSSDIKELLYRHYLGTGIDLSYAARIQKKSPFYLAVKCSYDHFFFNPSLDEEYPHIIQWAGSASQCLRTMLGLSVRTPNKVYFISSIFVGGIYLFKNTTTSLALTSDGIMTQSIYRQNDLFNLCLEAQTGMGIQCTDQLLIDICASLNYSNVIVRSTIDEIFSLPFSNQLINPNFTQQERQTSHLMPVFFFQIGIQFNYRFYSKQS